MKLKYRDDLHAYYLDGVRCKSVSTVAKVPDDGYNLSRWQQRQVALGMAIDGHLAERAIAHHDDKQHLDRVADDALRAAKSYEASARGTAIHRTLERHDLDLPLIDTPENRALRNAYDRALDGAGFDVIADYVERIVIHPDQKIAGRFDRIFRNRKNGRYIVGDIKSGSSAVKYPQSTAIQLALYANAPVLAANLPTEGGETETFEKMPERLDRRTGIIVYAPDPNHVDIIAIDLVRAWKIVTAAIFPILDWRKTATTDLLTPLGEVIVFDPDLAAPAERVAWIEQRLATISTSEHAAAAKQLVALRWPEGVPTPKRANRVWTDDHIDQIAAALTDVEKDMTVGFPAKDPVFDPSTAA